MVRYNNINTKPGPGQPLSEEELRKFFKLHDTNGDGLLSKEELKKAFKDLGAFLPGFRAYSGRQKADANRDGYISAEELDCLVKYAFQLGYTVK